jgi:hypothetical protein
MKMKKIRNEAKSEGITAKKQDWVALIRMVQRIQGNPECFRKTAEHCDQKMCSFRDLCLPPDHGIGLSL